MIVTLKPNVRELEINNLIDELKNKNVTSKLVEFGGNKLLLLDGETEKLDEQSVASNELVLKVVRISTPYKLVSRSFQKENTKILVGDTLFGGDSIVIIAGPCSVESSEQIAEIAHLVKNGGANILRGGTYKPRKSPYFFQGLGSEGIKYLVEAKKKYNIPIVSEIPSIEKIDEFKDVDIIQVGARNMQNFELLKALGKIDKPILLKRGMSNTIEELLLSAEYIASNGNNKIILCERGIRTFEKATRNTLDLSAVCLLKKLTHLPVVVDPSHATGNWELVESMSLASIASGCDGLMIEVHNNPSNALSDGGQSIKVDRFENIVNKGRKIAEIIGRNIK